MKDLEIIQMNNGLLSVKEGQTVDIEALRGTKVYGRLLLSKGTKFSEKFDKSNFQVSKSGTSFIVQAFVINAQNAIVPLTKVFANAYKDSQIMYSASNKMYFVEFIHPTLDMSDVVAV